MDTFLGLSATTWAGLYTLLTLGLLLMAGLTAAYGKKQWEEARDASRETTRPYVTVTIEGSAANPRLIDLVVKNAGSRPAFEISLQFDPSLKAARATEDFDPAKAKMLTEPIAMLAPGQALSMFFDNHLDRAKRDDLPLTHQARARYRDSADSWYDDEYMLDFDAHRGASYVGVQNLHSIGKHLEEIRKTLKNASVLARSGSMQVDAAVESWQEKQARRTAELEEQEAWLERAAERARELSSPDESE